MNNFRVKNIHSCRLDGVFKSVIGCEKGKNILKAILEEILEIKIDKIELLNTELNKKNVKEQSKREDCLIKTKDKLIDVEVNSSPSKSIRNRNYRFIMTKHISQFTTGKNYYTSKQSILIDLDWNRNYNKIKSEYTMREKDDSENIYSNNILIYKIDMEKIRKLCYTKNIYGKYKYLKMITIENKEDLLDYTEGDSIMEEYAKELLKVNDLNIYNDILTKEEDDRLIRESEKLFARDEGIEEGIEQSKVEIARNMLNENVDVSFISRITGLSIEEIKDLM